MEAAYQKLLSKINVEEKTGCWLFGYRDDHNLITHDYKSYVASRLAFAYKYKLDYNDRSWQACHINEVCPNKGCCNPDHMYNGTNATNMNDAVRKGTHVQTRKIRCPKGHEYDRVYNGQRCCSTCRNEQRKKKRRLGVWK